MDRFFVEENIAAQNDFLFVFGRGQFSERIVQQIQKIYFKCTCKYCVRTSTSL